MTHATPTCIVTGAAGFIGCNLVRALNARGIHDLILVDHLNHPGKETNLRSLRYAEYLEKDVFRDQIRRNIRPPVTTLFHLGACSSTTEMNTEYLDDNNVRYTQELCEWCLTHGVRFIYASSAATYGDGTQGYQDRLDDIHKLQPLNPYGCSKQAFDLLARKQGWFDQITGLKYFNVYGPFEGHKGDMRSVVNKAYAQILASGELTLFRSHRPEYQDGMQVRDFIYVRDAVKVTLFFHDHPSVSGLFNCGTGQARSWLDLGRAVFHAMGRKENIRFIDMPVAIRDRYQYHTQADTTHLRQTGYSDAFTSLEEGIEDYVRNNLATAPVPPAS